MSLIHFFFDDEEVLPLLLWAQLVKSRGGWTCDTCGHYDDPLRQTYPVGIVAHHRDGNGNRHSGNHTLANGQVLCTRCHAAAHKQLRAEATV